MKTPFPGMDPYLEQPGMWPMVHTSLLVDIQRYLTSRVRPKYQVAIEQRTFLSIDDGGLLVGEPDTLVIAPYGRESASAIRSLQRAPSLNTYTVELPEPEEIKHRYLEVRDVETGEAITVIEILSPSNKAEDRARYERKRLHILASMTNLVEIDLLRAGRAMTMSGNFPSTDYRILISRAMRRPKGELIAFSVRNPIPDIPIPLRPGENEPILPLNQILHALYESAGYDLFVNYNQPAIPPLLEEDAIWATQLITQGASS